MTYSVEIPNLDALQSQFQRAPAVTKSAVRQAVEQSLFVLQATAKQRAPIKQGRLRQSILASPVRENGNVIEGSVGTNVAYAGFMEEGTGIYGPKKRPIRPTTKKALAFKVNGKLIIRKEVRGSIGFRYMSRSVKDNQPRVTGFFEAAGRRIAEQIAGGGA